VKILFWPVFDYNKYYKLKSIRKNMESTVKKSHRKLTAVICYCCGEKYHLRDFSEENPLEVCGECGAEYFLPYSRNCLKGYKCLEQYEELLKLLPEHISIPRELCPQLITEYNLPNIK